MENQGRNQTRGFFVRSVYRIKTDRDRIYVSGSRRMLAVVSGRGLRDGVVAVRIQPVSFNGRMILQPYSDDEPV